jgi:hypothetical protein
MTLLSPGTTIVKGPRPIASVTATETARTAIVGTTTQGPLTARLVSSFDEFLTVFGGPSTTINEVYLQARLYFGAGGRELVVKRVVHYTDIDDPETFASVAAEVEIDNVTPVPTLLVAAKWTGDYGNNLTVRISAATNGEAAEFNLSVLENGVVVETFANLKIGTALALDTRYVETIINGVEGATAGASNLITVTDLGATPARPVDGDYDLAGGDDGLTSLDDADYTGSSAGGTGLYGLDDIQGIRFLTCPEGNNAVVHNAMCDYATARAFEMVAILDPPADMTPSEIVTYVKTTAGLVGLTEYAAIYWPQVKVANPNKTVYGVDAVIVAAPSGVICGITAANDVARLGGQYTPAAGIERGILTGVLGFASDEAGKQSVRDLLYPQRINPLNTEPGQPRYVNGVLGLDVDGDFPTVSERRTANLIADLLKRGTQFAVHANNDVALRARFTRQIIAILTAEMNRGAFASRVPEEAFVVDTGPGVNTPETIAAGQLIAKVGIATSRPAQFIIISIAQLTAAA